MRITVLSSFAPVLLLLCSPAALADTKFERIVAMQKNGKSSEAVRLAISEFGPEAASTLTAKARQWQSQALRERGSERMHTFRRIVSLLEVATEILESAQKADPTDQKTLEAVASIYRGLSVCHRSLGNWEPCFRYSTRHKSATVLAYGADSHEFARALAGHGEALQQTGKTSEAIVDFEKANSIYRRLVKEPKHLPGAAIDFANCLKWYGDALKFIDELPKCRQAREEAVQMLRSCEPQAPPMYLGIAEFSLGSDLLFVGEVEKAIAHLEASLAVAEKLGRSDGLAAVTKELALAQVANQNPEAAIRYFKQSLQHHHDSDVPQFQRAIPKVMTLLAEQQLAIGEIDQGKNNLEEAARLFADIHGGTDGMSLLNEVFLACAEFQRSPERKNAERIGQLSERADKVMGIDDRDAIWCKDLFADALCLTGEANQAFTVRRDVLQRAIRRNSKMFSGMSDAELLFASGRSQRSLEELVITAFDCEVELTDEVYSSIWNVRNTSSRDLFHRQSLRREASTTLTTELAKLNEQRAELLKRPLAPKVSAELNIVESRISKLQRQFVRPDGTVSVVTDVSPESLFKRLPRNAAVIHFVRTSTHFDRILGPKLSSLERSQYFAFVLTRDKKDVSVNVVNLGPAKPIDEAIPSLKDYMQNTLVAARGLKTKRSSAKQAGGESMFELVWKPISGLVAGKLNLYVIPDGAIANLPWAAIQLPNSEWLITRHRIAVCADGHSLYSALEDRQVGTGVLLCGNPDFGAESEQQPAFPALPETAREVSFIEKLFQSSVDLSSPVSLTGSTATREQVMKQIEAAGYIHLATHFFNAEDVKSPDEVADLKRAVGRNPFVYPHIVLAGANSGATDSMLTAAEILGLDLSKTRLVVLSGCATAAGLEARGEGAYGMQRVFQLAGAKTVIASLWPVDDESTQILMREFYTNMIVNRQTCLDALQTAQLSLLNSMSNSEEARARWSGWILSGDFR